MGRYTVRNPKVRFHRNGVGGESFYLVQFREGNRPMVAVVFDTPRQVAVFAPDNPHERFRGDVFEAELREAVAMAIEDGSAYQDEETIVRAPWTDEEIMRLRRRQGLDGKPAPMHAYTCVRHSRLPLVPNRGGWSCQFSGCTYRQDWAHRADVEGEA